METREEIVSKIEAKSEAARKLELKPEGIDRQVAMYEKALADYEAKIVALKERVEKFKASSADAKATAAMRRGEAEHMEQILERYDNALAERETVQAVILEKISGDNWMPGDDPELKNSYKRDPEFIEAKKRKQDLDYVIDNALPDVRKIMNSRGEVSVYHEKVEN